MIYDADASRSADKKWNALLPLLYSFPYLPSFGEWHPSGCPNHKTVRDGKQNRAKKEHVDLSKQRLNRIMTIFLASLCACPHAGCFTYTHFYSLNLPDVVNLTPQTCHWGSKRVSPLIPLFSHPHRMRHTYFPLKWFPKGGTFPKNSWPLASPHRGIGVLICSLGWGMWQACVVPSHPFPSSQEHT